MEHDTASISDSEEIVDLSHRTLFMYDHNSDETSESGVEVSKRN